MAGRAEATDGHGEDADDVGESADGGIRLEEGTDGLVVGLGLSLALPTEDRAGGDPEGRHGEATTGTGLCTKVDAGAAVYSKSARASVRSILAKAFAMRSSAVITFKFSRSASAMYKAS